VSIGFKLSEFKNIDIGVPYGSILGPLLFIIYIYSLPEHVNCKVIMYTDDKSLLLLSKTLRIWNNICLIIILTILHNNLVQMS
jgi:hypothetical protein